MKWQFFIQLLITIIVVIAGWFVVHLLTANRDRVNKHRDIRMDYLITAYQRLENAVHRKQESKYFRDMESSVADIQLFGNESQIEQVKIFLKEFEEKGLGSVDDLLNNLRDELREELNLSKVEGNVRWFRPEGAGKKNK